MTLQELKNKILTNTFDNKFLILQCENNYFLADQYIQKLCELNQYDITYITSLTEVLSSTNILFNLEGINLRVLKVDTFNEILSDYENLFNCIVICKSIDKNILSLVSNYTVVIPAPVDWQINDYIITKCPGLTSKESQWLYNITKKDLYKLTNELDKISLFPVSQQLKVFSHLRFDPNSDLYAQAEYQMEDETVNQNKVFLKDYFIHQNTFELDTESLLNKLLVKVKLAYFVKFVPNTTAESLNISTGQFNQIKFHNTLNKIFCLRALDFLTDLNFKLKTGQLELSGSELITYIVCKLLSY